MRRHTTAALVLSAALLAGGCTDPYGRVDYGRTALLGVGVGAAAALTAGALSDGGRHRRHRGGRDYYGGGYGYGGSPRDYGGYGYGAPRGYGYSGYGYGAPRGYGYSGYGYGPQRGYYGGW